MDVKKSKRRVFLSTLLIVGLISFGMLSKRDLMAYQFTGISTNTDSGRHRELLWVFNAEASTALANGDVAQWFDGTYDGVEVKIGADADSNLVAGVAIGAIAAQSWGFIQTRGYHSAIKIEVSNAAADALSIGSADGKAKVSSTAGMRQFAVALEATVSSTTVKGFIRT